MPEIGNTAVFSQTDANNNTGTKPSWAENMATADVNDSARALQGAITREWNWRNFTKTAGGTADVLTLTYTVAPAAYYNGQIFSFTVGAANNTGSATMNVNGLGAKTIKKNVDGTLTNLAADDLVAATSVQIRYNNTDNCFELINGNVPASTTVSGTLKIATSTQTILGTIAGKAVAPSGLYALWGKGADAASAGTLAFGDGGYAHVTGTTTITDIDFTDAVNGRPIVVVFDGILTLTHHATTLILPGAANITTAAGDTACFVQDSADNIKCIWYQRASGAPLIPSGMVYIANELSIGTGASKILDNTDITRSYKRIEIVIRGFKRDAGTSIYTLELSENNGGAWQTAINITDSVSATQAMDGSVIIDNCAATSGFRVLKINTYRNSTGFTTTDSMFTVERQAVAAAAVNAIRFKPGGGANFAAGNITVIGYP